MARRLPPADAVGKPAKRPSAARKAADELQVLDPAVRITVGGEDLTVREYGFFQFSRVAAQGAAFLADLQAVAMGQEVDDVWDEVRLLFGAHESFCRYAIAESVGKPAEWVDAISDHEIEPLAYLWWSVAGRFFFGEVMRRARARHLKAQLDGSMSSTLSAETSSALAVTPSAS